jgi:hypothetical protein
VKAPAQTLHDLTYELAAIISNQILREGMVLENVLEQSSGNSFRLSVGQRNRKRVSGEHIDSCEYPFITLVRTIKLAHKVDSQHVHWGFGKERSGLGAVPVDAGFASLARHTGFDPSADITGEARPVELSADIVPCAITPNMAGNGKAVIMI